jgi:purine-binding chemotaxis protein CheW
MLNKKQKNTFLSFSIHKETFAVSVKKVPEVLQKQYITKIPNTPEFIKGVINFRGNIIPAIEMRSKFGMPERPKNQKYVIIVFDLEIETKKILVGAIADRVNDVIAFNQTDVKDVPDLGLEYSIEFIKGMVKSADKFIMILDIDKIFSHEEVNIISKSNNNKSSQKKEQPEKKDLKEKIKKKEIEKKPESKSREKPKTKNDNSKKKKRPVTKRTLLRKMMMQAIPKQKSNEQADNSKTII